MALKMGRGPLLIVGGAVLATLIAVSAAILFKARDNAPSTPPEASASGLVVQTNRADEAKPDSKRSLRCFVAGQFEGVETLADCARKNGVATEALDVGVDQTGALAAANGQTGAALTPLAPLASGEPPAESAPEAAPTASPQPTPPHGPGT
jgi:hypothetical protein